MGNSAVSRPSAIRSFGPRVRLYGCFATAVQLLHLTPRSSGIGGVGACPYGGHQSSELLNGLRPKAPHPGAHHTDMLWFGRGDLEAYLLTKHWKMEHYLEITVLKKIVEKTGKNVLNNWKNRESNSGHLKA